jgi:WD40 repeat protein
VGHVDGVGAPRGPRPVRVLRGHTGAVMCLARDGPFLASGSKDRCIRIWRLSKGNRDPTLSSARHENIPPPSDSSRAGPQQSSQGQLEAFTPVAWEAHSGTIRDCLLWRGPHSLHRPNGVSAESNVSSRLGPGPQLRHWVCTASNDKTVTLWTHSGERPLGWGWGAASRSRGASQDSDGIGWSLDMCGNIAEPQAERRIGRIIRASASKQVTSLVRSPCGTLLLSAAMDGVVRTVDFGKKASQGQA